MIFFIPRYGVNAVVLTVAPSPPPPLPPSPPAPPVRGSIVWASFLPPSTPGSVIGYADNIMEVSLTNGTLGGHFVGGGSPVPAQVSVDGVNRGV